MKVAIPVIKELVAPHFGKAKALYIFDTESGENYSKEIPEIGKGKGRGRIIAEMLRREGVKVIICKNIGEGAREKLIEAGIEVRKTNAKRVVEVAEAEG